MPAWFQAKPQKRVNHIEFIKLLHELLHVKQICSATNMQWQHSWLSKHLLDHKRVISIALAQHKSRPIVCLSVTSWIMDQSHRELLKHYKQWRFAMQWNPVLFLRFSQLIFARSSSKNLDQLSNHQLLFIHKCPNQISSYSSHCCRCYLRLRSNSKWLTWTSPNLKPCLLEKRTRLSTLWSSSGF